MVSVPLLGELIYQPRLIRLSGASNRLFYRPPTFPDGFLPESSRLDPESRRVTIKAIRSCITLFGQKKRCQMLLRLQGLAAPIMTVWGTEDRYIPVSHAYRIGRVLPRTEVRTISECGHWPHMEKPAEFNALLIQFLNGRPDDVAGCPGL